MPTPQRCFVEKEKKHSISVIVFMNLKGGFYLRLLTGSKGVAGSNTLKHLMPAKTYMTRDGHEASRMTSEEYIDCCKAAVEYFDKAPRTIRGRAAWTSSLRLIHDRSTCHQRSDIILDQGKRGTAVLPVITAPPRSPDLMPLDYGVFGTAKNKLLAAVSQHTSWQTRAEMFVKLLQECDVKNIITSYPKRLAKCVENKGGRVEGFYSKKTS